jgi:hypothetical protein
MNPCSNLHRWCVRIIVALGIIGFALALVGCGTFSKESEGWRGSARASGSETHAFNMARLAAEIDHAKQPLVVFEASPEALQILAASGKPLTLTVNNPYLSISRPESPWWHKLVPDFRDLAWVGTTIYTVERGYSRDKRAISSAERTHQAQSDANERTQERLINLANQPD